MRLHRFYIGEKIGGKKEVVVESKELANQISKVFRLSSGDEVIIFDGSGSDYVCALGKIEGKRSVHFTVKESMKSRYLPKKFVTLCAALVKKDTFEWIAEKATELGVSEIVPVLSSRSEKKSLNEERLKKIITEASEQSGRGDVPALNAIVSLPEYLNSIASLGDGTSAICFHTEGEEFNRSDLSESSKIFVFIGPEGGWTKEEIEMFHSLKIPVRCLGAQILRSETAVISALSSVTLG